MSPINRRRHARPAHAASTGRAFGKMRTRRRRIALDAVPAAGFEIEPVDPEFDEEGIEALVRDVRAAAGGPVDPEAG